MGKQHNYFYVDHNLLSIIYGIATPMQTELILQQVVLGYQSIYRTYNATPTQVWSIPGNFYPLSGVNETVVSSGAYGKFPAYENGGSFFHSSGLEIAAEGVGGRGAMGWATFTRFMDNGYVSVCMSVSL